MRANKRLVLCAIFLPSKTFQLPADRKTLTARDVQERSFARINEEFVHKEQLY
jgi:hypothetical protein